jgi:alkylhydroperoxidase/carboxymuconolactone decarboxylase family protein YurZ
MSGKQPVAERLAALRQAAGAPGDKLVELVDAIYDDGALDAKTRELIFIAVQTALRLHGALRVHVPRAIAAGATRAEIMSAMMTAVLNGGINGAVEGWPIAAEILDQHGR